MQQKQLFPHVLANFRQIDTWTVLHLLHVFSGVGVTSFGYPKLVIQNKETHSYRVPCLKQDEYLFVDLKNIIQTFCIMLIFSRLLASLLTLHTVKKVTVFLVSRRDVINQTLPGWK